MCWCLCSSERLERIERLLHNLNRKADKIVSQQDDLNADVASIEAGVTALSDAATNIQAEIAALQAANPALDLTGLNTAVADLGNAVSAVSALQTPPAPPAG